VGAVSPLAPAAGLFCWGKEEDVIKPYKECPRFEKCSVNRCPLDIEAQNRISLPDDPDTECRARIVTRKKIALKYGLLNKGMTQKEIRRERRSEEKKTWWNSLPEEEKQKRLANLKPRQKIPAEPCKGSICSES
jgi:hypothetical protein